MFDIYFEDIALGEREVFGSRAVSRDEIVRFAAEYDPQPFHLDEASARHTPLGGLCASGWHTGSMMMRMLVDHTAERRIASLGSLGLDYLRWLKPVRPGDTLRVATEVVEKRPSSRRRELGLMKLKITVANQHGEPVLELIANTMVARRAAGE